ncbi:25053_t:CDS:2 [Gigaspora margarita]|uniref:25053_t:CDS:1 n=1 Tax=Gigaspora margarita TaxID=4874 RepID=A0ABN7V169_GIGMA|nr:25053_t:CDS:2 [Gigaspora margarita]
MSNNISESSFLNPYLRIYSKRQEAFMILPNFSFINDLNIDNYFDFYNETLSNPFNNSQVTEESAQLIQEKHGVDQKVIQYEYRSNKESDCKDKNNDPMIKADYRKRESKKTGCQWQLNVGYQKISGEIVINKLVKDHNHSLVLYQKEFAPSLRLFLQEAKIYMFTTFCTGMQSTQWVEGTNGLIKTKISAKTTLFNLDKAIQMKLEHEVQRQQLLDYKMYCQPEDFQVFKLSTAHEYTDRYLEDKYDALQASLKNLMNIVNCENILETWKVSLFDHYSYSYSYYSILLNDNIHFDVKLISKHWYTDLIQASNYSIIEGAAIKELDLYEQTNYFGIAKSGLKFALNNGLVDEFAGLIEKFIENYTNIDANNQMTIEVTRIENSKKLKHKGHPKISKSIPSKDKSDKLRQIIETDTKDKEEFEERSKK